MGGQRTPGGRVRNPITTADTTALISFRRNRLLQALVCFFALLWVWAAIDPVARQPWVLENVLVVACVAGLMATHKRYPLSDWRCI